MFQKRKQKILFFLYVLFMIGMVSISLKSIFKNKDVHVEFTQSEKVFNRGLDD